MYYLISYIEQPMITPYFSKYLFCAETEGDAVMQLFAKFHTDVQNRVTDITILSIVQLSQSEADIYLTYL